MTSAFRITRAGAVGFSGGPAPMPGLLVRQAAATLAGAMLIAISTAHLSKGFSLDKGGYDYALTPMAASPSEGGIAHGMLAMDANVFAAA